MMLAAVRWVALPAVDFFCDGALRETAFFLPAAFCGAFFLDAFLPGDFRADAFFAVTFLREAFLREAFAVDFAAAFLADDLVLFLAVFLALDFRDDFLLAAVFFDAAFAVDAFLLTFRFLPVAFRLAGDLRDTAFFLPAAAAFRFLLAVFFAGIVDSCRSEKNAELYIARPNMEAQFPPFSCPSQHPHASRKTPTRHACRR